jgi:lipid-binding SYLF domain-containing protein
MTRIPGIVAVLAAATLTWPATLESRRVDAADLAEVTRTREAMQVLRDLTVQSDDRIPGDVLRRAEGIVVVPRLLRGGPGDNARHGVGLASARRLDGAVQEWSPPAFVELRGGTVRWQIGAEATDLVLVLMRPEIVRRLADGRLTLNRDLSMATGPMGSSPAADREADVLAYSRARGFFAGAAFDRVTVRGDDEANEAFYGEEVEIDELLLGRTPRLRAPIIASDWTTTLRDLSSWAVRPDDRSQPPSARRGERMPPRDELAPLPGVHGQPVSLEQILKHPKDLYDRPVVTSGWVEDVYSGTAFAIDDDRLLTTGRGVLVVAPSLRRAITDRLDVVVAGDLLKFDKGEIEKRARGYRVDLSDRLLDRFDDRPVILAVSIRTRDGQELLDGRVIR